MKKINYIILTLLLFVSFKTVALASGTLSIWSNVSTAKVGQNVTISVKADKLAGKFSITSSNSAVLSGGSSSEWLENNTYSFTFTAKSAGSATITVTAIDASDSDAEVFSGSKSLTVVVENVTNNNSPAPSNPSGGSSGGSSGGTSGGSTGSKKNYSSNNNLKSLVIEGFTFTPDFSKEVLEYNLEVPNGTEKVKISGEAEDSKSEIQGLGDISLSEGANKVEIKVIAENGNEKIYVININVKELDPIEVKIGKDTFTIVRKEDSLTPPENYVKSTIKIGKEDVLCYKNETTDSVILALKNKKGEVSFYTYDAKNNKYTLYNGHKIGNLSLNIIDMPKDMLPSGYLKSSFTYDNSKITGYQYVSDGVTYAADDKVKGNDFYLIYAVNELTGEKGLYVYDKLENTIQRYNSSLFLTYQDKADRYFLYFLIAVLLLAVSVVTFTTILIKKKKHKNKFA